MTTLRKIFWIVLFAVAFAAVESSVVVYLRSLYYPEGFTFPLKPISQTHLRVELLREIATIIMLICIGALAGSRPWSKFAYFMIGFGVWDMFYYFWLKVMLNWPSSLLDLDILFLLPIPWIGPVIAPVVISILMILGGVVILRKEHADGVFRPSRISWILSIAGSAVILFSFMSDVDAGLVLTPPKPYRYELLVIATILYAAATFDAHRRTFSNQ